HVDEVDRFFDGQNVIVALGVDLVDHGRQGCRFARSRWSSHQHQPAGLLAHLGYDSRQPELIEVLNLKWNDAEYRRCRATLVEHIGTEAGQAFQSEREIEFEMLFEAVLL